jgi:hypothetical protein
VASRCRLLCRLKSQTAHRQHLLPPFALYYLALLLTVSGTLRRHSPNLLKPTMILSRPVNFSGGVGYHHRNCAFRLAFSPIFQSSRKCAIISPIRCTQIPNGVSSALPQAFDCVYEQPAATYDNGLAAVTLFIKSYIP